MGRSRIPFCSLITPLGAAVALALTVPAQGQTAPGDFRDFKLPTKPTQAPPVVGPTDGDAPAPRQSTPAPAPTATRAPAPAPRVTLPPAPAATIAPAAPRTSATTPRPAGAQPTDAATPVTGASPSAAPTTSSGSLFPSAPSPATSALPQADSLPPASAALPADEAESRWWLWPLLAAMLAVMAGLGWAASRRRGGAVRTPPEFVRPRMPQPVPVPAPASGEPANAAPVPSSAPAFAAAPGAPAVSIVLDATRMSATLINATLSYRLVVTNRSTVPISDLAVSGDMISAHASVSDADMLSGGAAAMPALHRITALAPGESMTLTGDIRLPLAAITPIRRGEAQLFVPLARFRTSGTAAGLEVTEHSAFLVGQEPEARAKLQPFRLDLGPRLYSQVGQRPIVVAA